MLEGPVELLPVFGKRLLLALDFLALLLLPALKIAKDVLDALDSARAGSRD